MRSSLAPFLAAAFVAASLAGPARAESGGVVLLDRVVAIVDGGPILRSEIVARARPMAAQLPKNAPPDALELLHARVRDVMIEERLIRKRADKLRITVSDAEVASAMESIAKNVGIPVADLEAEVRRQGITLPEYHAELRRQLLEGKWVMLEVRPRLDPALFRPEPPGKAKDPRAAAEADRARMEALSKKRDEVIAELRRGAYVEVR